MADADPALPPPPPPAALVPEPVPVVAPAPGPAVVALLPEVEQEVNFHSCYKSSVVFSFGGACSLPCFCRFARLLFAPTSSYA